MGDIIQARSAAEMADNMLDQAGSTPEGDATYAELAMNRALIGIGYALLAIQHELDRRNDIAEGVY